MRRQVQVDLLHSYAVWDRTNQRAEITPDAFGFVHARNAGKRRGVRLSAIRSGCLVELGNWRYGDDFPAVCFAHCGSRMRAVGPDGCNPIHMDALVSAVPAGGVAELAADACFFVNARDDFVVEVEVLPFLHASQTLGLEIGDCAEHGSASPE